MPADDDVQLIAMQQAGWPAYAWSFPIGDGTANVGFGMLLPRLRATGRPAGEVLHGRLAELLPDRPARDLRAHHLPLSTGRPRPGAGRVMLAGDAGEPDQPADRRGHLLRAAVRAARRGVRRRGAGRPPAAPTGASSGGRSAGTCAPPTCSPGLAQSTGFIDAAIGTAVHRKEVFDLLVEVGLGAGTVPPPLALAVGAAGCATPWAAEDAESRLTGERGPRHTVTEPVREPRHR